MLTTLALLALLGAPAAPAAATLAAATPAAPAPAAGACAALPQYRQLDFWIGDWAVFETDRRAGDAPVARARIEPTAHGCGLHELYEQDDGLVGDSLLAYDAVRRSWQQTWISSRGAIMTIAGTFRDGALVLQGEVHLQDGKTVLQRVTWRAQGRDVRESALVSRDGGKTWAPAFDVVFRRSARHARTAAPGRPVRSAVGSAAGSPGSVARAIRGGGMADPMSAGASGSPIRRP